MRKILLTAITVALVGCGSIPTFKLNVSGSENDVAGGLYDPLAMPDRKPVNVGSPIENLEIRETNRKITINGRSYIDESANIETIVDYSLTGYITYTTSKRIDGERVYSVILDKPFKNYRNKIIAKYTEDNGKYRFTVPGTDIERVATRFKLISQGVLLIHNEAYYSFIKDKETSELIEIPDGFELAPIQSRDMSKSRYIAFIKDAGPVTYGIINVPNKRLYDFLFMDALTGEKRSLSRLRVKIESGSNYIDSLKEKINFYMTNDGLLVVDLQDNYKNLYVRNLHMGVKKELFTRDNGIAWFKSGISEEYKVWVKAAVGFENKERRDVQSFIVR